MHQLVRTPGLAFFAVFLVNPRPGKCIREIKGPCVRITALSSTSDPGSTRSPRIYVLHFAALQ